MPGDSHEAGLPRVLVAHGSPLRSFSIDVLPVPDSLHLDDVRVAEYLVDDSVISNADSVGALGAGELLRAVWKRIICELADGLNDARHLVTRQTPRDAANCECPFFVELRH